jgi:hypothetical protein
MSDEGRYRMEAYGVWASLGATGFIDGEGLRSASWSAILRLIF